jgi:hypothetical protein
VGVQDHKGPAACPSGLFSLCAVFFEIKYMR